MLNIFKWPINYLKSIYLESYYKKRNDLLF